MPAPDPCGRRIADVHRRSAVLAAHIHGVSDDTGQRCVPFGSHACPGFARRHSAWRSIGAANAAPHRMLPQKSFASGGDEASKRRRNPRGEVWMGGMVACQELRAMRLVFEAAKKVDGDPGAHRRGIAKTREAPEVDELQSEGRRRWLRRARCRRRPCPAAAETGQPCRGRLR